MGGIHARASVGLERAVEGRIGEGGLIKQPRRRERPDDREGALSRLTTTRPDKPFDKKPGGKFGGDKKPGGKFGGGKSFGAGKPGFGQGKDKRDDRPDPGRARTTNVWMAPGARPQGKKGAGAFSPLEGDKAAKRPEGIAKHKMRRKEKHSTAETTPPGRFAATLPSRGREGGAPRRKGKPGADRRR